MATVSIVFEDMDSCYFCGALRQNTHHIIYGNKDKKWSTKYKLLAPLCARCHMNVHKFPNDGNDLKLKQMAQEAFEVTYPDLDWMDYFSKNYL